MSLMIIKLFTIIRVEVWRLLKRKPPDVTNKEDAISKIYILGYLSNSLKPYCPMEHLLCGFHDF